MLILIYGYAQNVRVLAGRHSNRTCRSPFQQHFQVGIPTALAGRHSNSTCSRHSKSLPTPPIQKPSKNLYNYLAWVRLVVISLCCVLVAVGSGFMIFGTGCDRVRFPVVIGTIWLQYGPSGCSRDYFGGRGGGEGWVLGFGVLGFPKFAV